MPLFLVNPFCHPQQKKEHQAHDLSSQPLKCRWEHDQLLSGLSELSRDAFMSKKKKTSVFLPVFSDSTHMLVGIFPQKQK